MNNIICQTCVGNVLVSTLERYSSARVVPSPIYWETLVWSVDPEDGSMKEIIEQGGSLSRDLREHFRLVEKYVKQGRAKDET